MRKNIRGALVLFILLLAAANIFAAGKPGDPITVTGTLVKGGVECQRLRADRTGTFYTLTPRPAKKFKNGQHVRVTGKIAGVSICQQDTTIVVKTIKRV
jgi:hypothetical protein